MAEPPERGGTSAAGSSSTSLLTPLGDHQDERIPREHPRRFAISLLAIIMDDSDYKDAMKPFIPATLLIQHCPISAAFGSSDTTRKSQLWCLRRLWLNSVKLLCDKSSSIFSSLLRFWLLHRHGDASLVLFASLASGLSAHLDVRLHHFTSPEQLVSEQHFDPVHTFLSS